MRASSADSARVDRSNGSSIAPWFHSSLELLVVLVAAFVLSVCLSAQAIAATQGPQLPQGPLVCGTVHEAQIRLPGESHRWTIDAAPGDLLDIAVQTLDLHDGLQAAWTLRGPDGAVVGNGRDIDALRKIEALGDHELIVADANGSAAVGRYAVQVQWVSAAGSCAERVLCGTSVQGRIATGVQHDVYSFVGGRGEVVDIAVAPSEFGTRMQPVCTLLDEQGKVINRVRQLRSIQPLPYSGRYGLLIEDASLSQTGEYSLSLLGVSETATCGAELKTDIPEDGLIAFRGDRASFVFNADEGEKIGLTLSPVEGPPGVLFQWDLFAPNGTRLLTAKPEGRHDLTLRHEGGYTVVVTAEGPDPTGKLEMLLERPKEE